MTKLKIIVSPFYSKEEYVDKTTGFAFKKTDSPYIVSLNDERLKGIKEGLRNNFLIPYDKETLEFISKNDLPLAPSEPSQEIAVEEEKEQSVSNEDQEALAVASLSVEAEVEVETEKTKKSRSRRKKEEVSE